MWQLSKREKPEFSLSSDSLIEYMNYTLSEIIQSQGPQQALLTICFVIAIGLIGMGVYSFTS